MTTRCKFKCNEVTKSESWNKAQLGPFLYSAKFSAVASGSPENNSFFAATPAGSLSVSTVREDIFVPGKSYYLDITEAPEG